MNSLSSYLITDHEHCDSLFVEMENAASKAQWSDAETLFYGFRSEMELHFSREEQVLFPAFEQATTASGGPTMIMRTEHEQMRRILQKLEAALKARDAERFLGESETLLPLMQQHNLKEESVLYQMANRILASQAGILMQDMQAIGISS